MSDRMICDMSDSLKQQRDYAWNYFQIHAAQRMTTFNFFVILAGLLTAGLARTLVSHDELRFIGFFLGIALIVIAFSFWQLDKRVKYLIGLAESKLRDIEKIAKKEEGWNASIFIEERTYSIGKNLENNNVCNKFTSINLSYTCCFIIVYLTFAMLGLMGIIGSSLL